MPSGFAGPTAVASDFNGLLNVSGYGSDPLPLPLMDNAKFVKSLGLRDSIRPEDVQFLKTLIKLFFGHVTPANLYIRKTASTTFPFFTTDNQYKKLAALKTLHNADDFLKSFTGDESGIKYALQEYHALNLFGVHERQQPDSVVDGKSKDRFAPTEAEARAGDPATLHVDKSVKDEFGNVIEGHFAMRRRPVFGFSGPPNYFLTAIVGCHREVYTNRFAFTYKTKGRLDKEDRIKDYKYVVGSDVKNMDTTIPRWFFSFLLDELGNYWAEPLVALLRRMFGASYVVPPPWRSTPPDYDPVFGPSPLEVDAPIHTGLPSGIAINPDIGKLWMTFVYIILFRDAGAIRSVNDIEPFLQGKLPNHGLLDMSDDATLMTNSPTVRDHLVKATSPYAVLEPETPVIFLGDVFAEDGGRKRAYPNPVTYLVNAIARETSIETMHPINYAEGVLARYEQYSATPVFRDLNRIYEEEVRDKLGVNPYLIARAVARRQRFEELDSLVLANPHYLHYRVDPKDVSPEALDELVSTIPAKDFFNHIRHLFKVPTIEMENLNE
jgi:hypothetical protein